MQDFYTEGLHKLLLCTSIYVLQYSVSILQQGNLKNASTCMNLKARYGEQIEMFMCLRLCVAMCVCVCVSIILT